MKAVLLLAFGGPTRPEEIRPFLANVVRGRPVPAERVEEVARHYETVGGCSPLREVTFRQAQALRENLVREQSALPVFVGMRNWEPYIVDTLREMAACGVRSATGIVLAPHRSEASWDRYLSAVETARASIGPSAPTVDYAPPWHVHPLFIEAVASRVEAQRATLGDSSRASVQVVFTAHSIPVAMSDASRYSHQVEETARLISKRLCLESWSVAYQSRSGNPRDSWLEPDILSHLHALAAKGTAHVIAAPIGFVSEQVELTYDLDVEMRGAAAELDIGFGRARAVDDHPAFIRLLGELARGTLTVT